MPWITKNGHHILIGDGGDQSLPNPNTLRGAGSDSQSPSITKEDVGKHMSTQVTLEVPGIRGPGPRNTPTEEKAQVWWLGRTPGGDSVILTSPLTSKSNLKAMGWLDHTGHINHIIPTRGATKTLTVSGRVKAVAFQKHGEYAGRNRIEIANAKPV